MEQSTSNALKPSISVDVNPFPFAEQLREVGGWGVAIIFLLLLLGVWKYFTNAMNLLSDKYTAIIAGNEEKHILELNQQREVFLSQISEQQKDVSQLLERRHEQFIQLIRDNQNTIATTAEVNRQEVELMSRVDYSLKEVDRVINRCKNAKNIND